MNDNKANNQMRGIFHIILAALGFALMSFFVRLSGDLPTMQKVFFRNLVAFFFTGYMVLKSPEGIHFKKEGRIPLFLRCAIGMGGVICNFWAVSNIGLADANILNKLAPFAAMIMSIFILREVPNAFEWMTVAAAFIVAACVVKPTAGIASLPALVGALGGFCAGTAYTYVRKLGKLGERREIIVFAFSGFSCLVSLPFFIIGYQPMTWLQLLWLILAGTSAMIGQLNVTAAYSYAPASDISVFDYSQVVFAALLGFFVFGELPDVFSFVGYTLIIGAAVLKWYVMRKRAQSGGK